MSDNLPTIQDVFNNFNQLYKLIDLIDNTYKIHNGNYLMKYYQNRGVTLREIFTNDMLNWLCYLGWGDGNIEVNEVQFINDLLNLDLTQLDVLDIVKNLNMDILTTLPLTFAIFMEFIEVSGTDVDGDKFIQSLYSSFAIAGTFLIICDGDIHENELNGLHGYLGTLERNIKTFDLDSLHDYMLDNI